jgi:uncharacterized protein with von Willebrand factor type A (vWA) domain
MLIRFLSQLREAGLPVSVTEYLALLESLKAGIAETSVDNFYVLARTVLVKDERYYDRYDRVFAAHFSGIESMLELLGGAGIPEDWLKRLAELHLSPEEKAKIESLGGLEKVMEALKERLKEQEGRHQGGSKWIGTAGRSPFGAYGYNPEGVRIGQDESRQRSAIKVWDRREFRNLDDSLELGTRNLQVALRRLRRFAREGAAEELDLEGTIDATARNAGWLDLKLRPERHNAIKVLLFLKIIREPN